MSERKGSSIPLTYIEDQNVALRVAHAGKESRDKSVMQRQESRIIRQAGIRDKLVFLGKKVNYDAVAKREENDALKLIDTFTRLKESSVVDNFLLQTAQRAVRIGRSEVGSELVNIRTSTPLELFDEYNSEEWVNKTPLVRAITDIAVVAASKGKVSETIHITSGKRQLFTDTLRDKDELLPEDSNVLDQSDPNLGVVEDLYTILGLRDHVGDIPEISHLSSFERTKRKKFTLSDVGIDLQFQYKHPFRISLTDNDIHEPARVMLKVSKH